MSASDARPARAPLGTLALFALATGFALALALGSRRPVLYAVDDVLAMGGVALGLFAACGVGPTRLALPAGLRRHEWLWIVPVGAATSAIAFAVLGYAGVPLTVSMVLVPVAGAALGIHAIRRNGPPPRPTLRGFALPAWVTVLVACVSLIPMLREGFPTVQGYGSDAHLAAGTAQFLQHNYPTSTNIDEPLDQMHLAWRSKAPIYYPFAAVAELSGYETYQLLSTMTAIMGALAALGTFLFAREALGTGTGAALGALGFVGINRMVLHTVYHPYYNQTWGWFTMFFALVLAWWAVRERSRGGIALLALFLAVGGFAYPLMLPIPLLALAVFAWRDRAERRRRGERVAPLELRRRARGLYGGPRSLLWMVPLALGLAVPALGVLEKATRAAQVLAPGHSLVTWGGDVNGFFPEEQFLGLAFHRGWWIAAGLLAYLAWRGLRGRPEPLGWGVLAVIAFAALAAAYLRPRDHGWYFHYKVLAFCAPILVACAVAGVATLRSRALTVVLVVLYAGGLGNSVLDETRTTSVQITRPVTELRQWDRALPAGSSVRLDDRPSFQLWSAYFMHDHPVCSRHPLLGTDYPHVAFSRKADYVLAETRGARPADALGAPVFRNSGYTLWRMRPSVPGPSGCSKRLVRTQTRI